ncbi:MAG: hypothetical protein ABJR05_03240 [Balneola sp.]
MNKIKIYVFAVMASLVVGLTLPTSVISQSSDPEFEEGNCPQNFCDDSQTPHKCSASGVPSGQQYKCMNGSLPVSGSQASCDGTAACI